MKKFKKLAAGILLVCILMNSVMPVKAAASTKPSDGTTTVEPFSKGVAGSNSFRIPAMITLSDGTIVAAADARWNTTYDGGGLDTIVSRSEDNGATWKYTFANYLGDNGNQYNGSESTAFIDPALVSTADDTIYMLCDLYPYGVALNGNGNTTPVTTKGFNDQGYLLLSGNNHATYDYYLKDGKIYQANTNAEIAGYSVDAHFNITGTDGTNSNLFFADSPYKVVRTGYLYLTSSTDKGATWSEPMLLNLKTTSEMVCLSAPGRGLVTSSGMIVFPVYSFRGDNDPAGNTQRLSFIYSSDGVNWQRTNEFNYNWASESSVIELNNGTLRFFYRNGTTNLCYVDYNLYSNSWGAPVNTGIDTNSNCQISAITYSKTKDGKQVILVSCSGGPAGGSNLSSASARLNGKILVGVVDEDGTISWMKDEQQGIPVDVQSKHSSNQFMYSCLTELEDGRIAILYEDNEENWGTGSNCYYEMSFATYDLDIADEDPEEEDPDEGAIKVTLKIGEIYETTDETGDYESSYTGEGLDTRIAQVTVDGMTKEGVSTTEIGKITMDEDGTYTGAIYDGTRYLTLNGTRVTTANSYADATKFTVVKNGDTYTIKSGNYYIKPRRNSTNPSLTVNTSPFYPEWSYSEDKGFYYNNYYLKYNGGWTVSIGKPNATAHLYGEVTTVVPGESYTSITITGVKPGKTYVTIGNTRYAITVLKEEVVKTIAVGDTYSCVDKSALITTAPNTAIASAELFNEELTIRANAVGTTVLETETTKYTIHVIEGYAITIKEGESLIISPSDPMGDGSVTGVTLEEGQYLEWSSSDGSYVGVAGVYDSANKKYTDEGSLFGYNVTETPVSVTGVVRNADGTSAGIYKWLVTVEQGVQDTNTSTRHVFVNVTEITNCTMYYSVNGGELIEMNGTGVLIDEDVTGRFNIMFFAKPNEGYLMTYMSLAGTAGQYYALSDGNPDGTGSDAWPFKSEEQSTIPDSSNDADWKEGHGFRWPLLEGNMTIEQMKVLFSNAIALGCHGVTGFTKNGTEDFYTEAQFVAQELAPKLLKEIVSITNSSGKVEPYTEGMEVNVGGTINYKITITLLPEGMGDIYIKNSYTPTSPITGNNKPQYETGSYGSVEYDNVILQDELTEEEWSVPLAKSSTSEQSFTYNTNVTVAVSNFLSVVKDGRVINSAELQYDCSSAFTAGSRHITSMAEAQVIVVLPEFVVDFGLPVEISLENDPLLDGYDTISRATSHYGEVTVRGLNIIYTPTKILQGTDYIELTIVDPNGSGEKSIGYGVFIHPATSVYYEEWFAQGTQGDWIAIPNTTNLKQDAESVGNKQNPYGYDSAYGNAGASNGSAAVSDEASIAKVLFYGTGLDIYTNNNPNSGILMVWVKNSAGQTVRFYQVDTHMESGKNGSYITSGQDVNAYNVPTISFSGLPVDTYTVELRHMGQMVDKQIVYKPVSLDGFRVHGTLDVTSDVYLEDGEFDPAYFELRDCVLAGLGVVATDSEYAEKVADDAWEQIYSATEGNAGAVVLSSYTLAQGENIDIQELLDNGPKNELYLRAGDAVIFKVPLGYEVQVGMKALEGKVEYELSDGVKRALYTNTDMFYVTDGVMSGDAQTITITNVGGGILSLTEVKLLASSQGAAMQPMMLALNRRDLMPALMSLGYESEVVEDEKTEQNVENVEKPSDKTVDNSTVEKDSLSQPVKEQMVVADSTPEQKIDSNAGSEDTTTVGTSEEETNTSNSVIETTDEETTRSMSGFVATSAVVASGAALATVLLRRKKSDELK